MKRITMPKTQKNRFIFLTMNILIIACRLFPNFSKDTSVLLVDDFSNSSNRWEIWEEPDDSAVSYFEEGLIILANKSNLDIVSTVPLVLDDSVISVSAKKRLGTNNNYFGIVCRYQDHANYYGFIASSDGYFAIIEKKSGELEILSSNSFQYSEDILKESGENRLEAACVGNQLSLSINNIPVAQVKDGAWIQVSSATVII